MGAHRAAHLHERGQRVYLLFHVLRTHRLRAEYAAVLGEQQFHDYVARARVVPRVRQRERVRFEVFPARLFELFLV